MNFKITKNIRLCLFIAFLAFTNSCTSFSKYSKFNEVNDQKSEVINQKLSLKLSLFGDFKTAKNNKEYRIINPNIKPNFSNIIFYGKTFADPIYEIYVLEGKLINDDNYLLKTIELDSVKLTLAISKNAPSFDVRFLQENFNIFFD